MIKKRLVKKVGIGAAAVALSAAMVLPIALNTASFLPAAAYSSSTSADKMLKASKELNMQIAEESAVLLKNNNNALPLQKGQRDVTVFHSISNTIAGYFGATENYMISALHAFTHSTSGTNPNTIYESFANNNINFNPVMKGLYDEFSYYVDEGENAKGINTRRGPNLNYIKKAEKSIPNYNDAAIITITRVGCEGYDGLRLQDPDESLKVFDAKPGEHYLQLNEGEKELISYAKEKFGKVVILLNTTMPVEIADLQYDDDIDAIMWIGYPGFNGFLAIGELLTGTVNPSGRITDTWAVDITKDPTWKNYYNNSQNFEDGKPHYSVLNDDGEKTKYVSIDYTEGIYVGYKFYETAAENGYFDATAPELAAGETDLPAGVSDRYYNLTNGVVYPFGYGMSYSQFEQKIVEGSEKTDGETISFQVEVKNVGSMPGKDVVQAYYNPPYTDGGIEKASANLAAFAKTKELAVNESQVVTLSFDKRDMASYDYDNANDDENGHTGYELEAGIYEIALKANSHEVIDSFEYDHKTRTDYDYDSATNTPIENLFSNNDWFNTDRTKYTADGSGLVTMSRASQKKTVEGVETTVNGFVATFPECVGDVTFSDAAIAYLDSQNSRYTSDKDKDSDPYYKTAEEILALGWTQENDPANNRNAGWNTEILLQDLIGIDYTSKVALTDKDTKVKAFVGKTGEEAWNIFMDQLTWDEMATIVSDGNFRTPAIDAIGKPATVDNDGPAQIGTQTYSCMNFASGINIASTWNVDLAEVYGKLIGDHAINQGITGWYGPGLNIHRSPFGGRNYEYYSEDATLAGNMAAGSIKGAASKGVVTYMKHFALNNQEESRHGVLTWADEQTMREIYLKVFEIATKKGGATGVMCSFNNVGGVGACMNYNLTVKLLTEEWGFKGAIITDAYGDSRWPAGLIVRSQAVPLGIYTNEPTGKVEGTWNAEKNLPEVKGETSPTLYYAVRMTAQRMLYSVANSNGMKTVTPIDESVLKINTDDNDNAVVTSENVVTIKQGADGYTWLGLGPREPKGYNRMFISGDTVGGCDRGSEWYTILPGFDWHMGGDSLYDALVAGEYDFTMWVTKDYLRSADINVKIIITSAFKDKTFTGTQGIPFDGQIELVEDAAVKSISACRVADGSALPAGLNVEADGRITGTATEAGTFEVKFIVNNKYEYDATLTVEAKDTHTVTFDGNYQDSANTSVEVNPNATVTAPETAPVREGYEFAGWYTDAECTTVADFTKPITAATSFYAKWTEKTPAGPSYRVHEGMLQYSEDGENWLDVIAVSELKGENGTDGSNGTNGLDGVGIKNATINDEGHLILTLTDGSTLDAGIVKGADGAEGGGCNGSLNALSIAVPVLLAGAFVATVAIRRRKNNK